MTQRFEAAQWVPYSVELVFAFFANPSNLPHVMPSRMKARIEDVRMQPPPPRPVATDPARRYRSVAAGQGSEILISFCPIAWLPQRVSWTARITEFVWNSHFVDEQVHGPFKRFRHRHGIAKEVRNGAEGTLVTDTVEFVLPGGVLAGLACGMMWKQLERSFDYRQRRLPEILAIATRQAAQRA